MFYKQVPSLIGLRLIAAFLVAVVVAGALPRFWSRYAMHLESGAQVDALQFATAEQIQQMNAQARLGEVAEDLNLLLPKPAEGFHTEIIAGYWFTWNNPLVLNQEWVDHVSQYGDVRVLDSAHACMGHIWAGHWFAKQDFPDVCTTGARAIAEQQSQRNTSGGDPHSGK